MYKRYIVNSLIKQASIMDTISAIPGSVKDNIVIPTGDKSQSFSERLGYTVGGLLGSKADDTDNLGPYRDVVKAMKDTEVAETYLREAAKLRRKARILKRKREEEEGLRNSVARTRFF